MHKFSSKAKKKLQHLLPGKKHKSDEPGADTSGERTGSASSLLRPESHVALAGGHDGRSGVNTVDGRSHSTDLSQPDHAGAKEPADGGENDRGGIKANIDGREIAQNDPRLLSEAEVGERSGPSREGDDADGGEAGQVSDHLSAIVIPAIPPNLEPHGKRTWRFW